jgi:hypothetical protein
VLVGTCAHSIHFGGKDARGFVSADLHGRHGQLGFVPHPFDFELRRLIALCGLGLHLEFLAV